MKIGDKVSYQIGDEWTTGTIYDIEENSLGELVYSIMGTVDGISQRSRKKRPLIRSILTSKDMDKLVNL